MTSPIPAKPVRQAARAPVGATLVCAALVALTVTALSLASGGARFRAKPLLVKRLQASGVSLRPATSASRVPFGVRTAVYTTVAGELHVFRFRSGRAAQRAARAVDHDGYTVARRGRLVHIDWIAHPHWFRFRRTLALYLGQERRVLSALRHIAGPAFAG